MNVLPDDVTIFLTERCNTEFRNHVIGVLSKIDIGGYFTQYSRSIIYNSHGEIRAFNEMRKMGDPRDVISIGDEGDGMFHWYSIPLSKIDEFKDEKEKYIDSKLKEEIPTDILKTYHVKSIGQIISELKQPGDEGYSVIELKRIFGRSYGKLPSAYIEFLKQMGKRNRIFIGIDHSPYNLREYTKGAYASQFFEPIWDEIKNELDNYFIFLSSQGCSWFMFRKISNDANPEVFLLNEGSLDVKLVYPSFIDMLRTLTK